MDIKQKYNMQRIYRNNLFLSNRYRNVRLFCLRYRNHFLHFLIEYLLHFYINLIKLRIIIHLRMDLKRKE